MQPREYKMSGPVDGRTRMDEPALTEHSVEHGGNMIRLRVGRNVASHRLRSRVQGHALSGQILPLYALTFTIIMGALLLGVDLSRLRTEAENAQRAANAAALAGVAFLPDYRDNAYTRAREEAAKNGFTDGHGSVTVTPAVVPGPAVRLKVSITEPVSLVFGQVFGLGQQTISRSATAEYDPPLQMGAPDYVLGYAPFPTKLTSASSTSQGQGFYLEARGPYGLQENGDAYSQYYESYKSSTAQFNASSSTASYDVNPCVQPASPPSLGTVPTAADGCLGLQPNPDRKTTSFDSYDYVVYNPNNTALTLKIFDPYDEGPFQQDAGSSNANNPNYEPMPSPYGNKFPDQYGCTNGGTAFCNSQGGSDPAGPYPTALQFSLVGPCATLYDTTCTQITTAPTYGSVGSSTPNKGTCSPTSAPGCVIAPFFTAGDDPTHTYCKKYGSGTSACNAIASPYAYKFLNYAIIYGKGYFHIHVKTTANPPSDLIYAGKYGTGGNIFGIAACANSSSDVIGRVISPSSDPSSLYGPSGGTTASGAAVADPAPASSPSSLPSTTWNTAACGDPNAGTPACASVTTATPDDCVHVFAEGRMCIYNNISGTKNPDSSITPSQSIIPLGYVPAGYDGKTLQIRLFDVGDVNGGVGGNNIQVLTPYGDMTHNNTNVSPSYPFPSNLPYTYSAAPTDCGNPCATGSGAGFIVKPETALQAANTTIDVGGATWNGSWLTIKVPISVPSTYGGKTYQDMVTGYGGYWKVLYNIAGTGNDTTTWEISINGAPVHLVSDLGSS